MAAGLVTFKAGMLGSAIRGGTFISGNQPWAWGTGTEIVGSIRLEVPGAPNIHSPTGAFPPPVTMQFTLSDGDYLVFWITGYLDRQLSRCYIILLRVQTDGKFEHYAEDTRAGFCGEGAVEVAFSETGTDPIRAALQSVGFAGQLPEAT